MNLQLAYAYRGLKRARPIGGTVYAASRAQARARLGRMNVTAARLRLAPLATLAAALAPGFDPLDLENFYAYLARVIERGLPRPQLLADAVEFAHDPRLRFALALVRDAVQEGATLANALRAAGFPRRDCELLAAGESSGRLPQILGALAREVRREGELRRNLQRLMLPPLLVALSAYLLAYLALVTMAPLMARKFAENASLVALPDYARSYYALVELFNGHLALSSALYVAAGAGVALLLRARLARAVAERLFPTFGRIGELSEMAQLWGAFALMTDSGVSQVQIAGQLARAGTRPQSGARFRRLERQCRLGSAIEIAIERAGFPRYVVAGVRAAAASGALADGTRDLAERLSIQAGVLTSRAQALITGLAALFGALLVLAFAAVTVLPQMVGLLSSF